MFESKYAPIFRSRWRALFWCACVLLTAYCTVPSEEGGDPAMEFVEGAARMAGEHSGQDEAAEPHHVNPWALDPDERS